MSLREGHLDEERRYELGLNRRRGGWCSARPPDGCRGFRAALTTGRQAKEVEDRGPRELLGAARQEQLRSDYNGRQGECGRRSINRPSVHGIPRLLELNPPIGQAFVRHDG